MEIITKETIDECHRLFMMKDKIEFDKFLLIWKHTQAPMLEFVTKKSLLMKGIKRNESTYQMFWVIASSFFVNEVSIPAISAGLINLYESNWSQRMRSHRSLGKEDMMAYIKSEISQTFLVEYVLHHLHEAGSEFEITDKELLVKVYGYFFAIIELYDAKISEDVGN